VQVSPGRIIWAAATVVSVVSLIALVALGYSVFALYQTFYTVASASKGLPNDLEMAPGFNITNNGLFPVSLALAASLRVNDSSFPIYTRELFLGPGQTGYVNFSALPPIERYIMTNGLLDEALFKGLNTFIMTDFRFTLGPFLAASGNLSQPFEVGPVVSDLRLRIIEVTPFNSTHVRATLSYSFFNPSTISLSGDLSVSVFNGMVGGDFIGSGDGRFITEGKSLTQGSVDLLLDESKLKGGFYYALLTVRAEGVEGTATFQFAYP